MNNYEIIERSFYILAIKEKETCLINHNILISEST